MQKQQQKNSSFFDFFTVVKFFVLFIVFSLIIYGVNQVVLTAIAASPTHQVGNGMINLYEVHNTGAAFNLFAGQENLIINASFLVVAGIFFSVLAFSTKYTQSAISALALLSSGITMNMIERLQHGYVIDYINCTFFPNLPVFNTADILIVFGALGLVFALFSKN